jgi:hypothetical protein
VNRVCRRAAARYALTADRRVPRFDPERPTAEIVARYGLSSASRLAVNAAIIKDMRALGRPKEASGTWRKLLGLIVRVEQHNTRQIVDAQSGDVDRFLTNYHRTVTLGAALHAAGAQAGFDLTSPCAAVL